MYKPVQTCTNCGAGLTLDDMRKTDCPYCGQVYPHHSMAAQHAAVAGQMFNQMVQQQQQMWGPGYGQPMIGMPPPPGTPGSPYGDPARIMQVHMQHAQKMSRNITMIVTISIIGSFVLVGAIVALTLFL